MTQFDRLTLQKTVLLMRKLNPLTKAANGHLLEPLRESGSSWEFYTLATHLSQFRHLRNTVCSTLLTPLEQWPEYKCDFDFPQNWP